MTILSVIFVIVALIDEGYSVKDCGPLEAGQYCNYDCDKVLINCSSNGTVIQLRSGSYGFWKCHGNCDKCELPSDDPGKYLCEQMEDEKFQDAKAVCYGATSCTVTVKPIRLKNSDNCCPHNNNRKCKNNDMSLVTALKWTCPQVSVGCYSSEPKLKLQCGRGTVIDIIDSQYGLSTTDTCQDGLWEPDDCMVPGDEARLEHIQEQCQHYNRCQIVAQRKDHACDKKATNYERVYYNCVPAPIPPTTSSSLITSASDEMSTSSGSKDSAFLPRVVGGVFAFLLVLAIGITGVICYRKLRKPVTTNANTDDLPSTTKQQGLQRQSSILNVYDTIPDDDPAKYYEIQDLKIQKSKTDDLIKPSLGKSQPPLHTKQSATVTTEGELEDIYDTRPPEDPNLVQEPDRFDPSKVNPAFLPGEGYSVQQAVVAPNNDYSYAYGHWGTESDDEDEDSESPESGGVTDIQGNHAYLTIIGDEAGLTDANDANGGLGEETIMEDNDAYGGLGEGDETIMAENDAYGGLGK